MSNTLEDIRRGVYRKLVGETIWGDVYTTVNGNIAAPTTTVTLPTTFKSSFITDNHFQGWYFYVCDNNADSDGTPPGTTIRIVSYDASAGTIVLDENLSESGAHNCLDTGCEIELTPYHPKLVETCINEFLRQTYYPCEWPVTVHLADNDMEDSGTSSWTAGSSTVAKDTTAANVVRGAQSLSVTDSGSGDGTGSQAFSAVAADEFSVWAIARNSAAATECRLDAMDDTAGDSIMTATGKQTAWQLLGFPFTIPSGCEAASIKLRTITASGVVYWDNVQLISHRRRNYPLPSWITEEWQVANREVVLYRGAGQLASDTYNYMPEEDRPYRVLHPQILRDGSQLFLRFDGPVTAGRPYLRALRPYAELATSSATAPTGGTTTCDLDFAIQGGLVTFLERLAGTQPGEEREGYRDWFLKEKTKLDRMRADFQPWARKPKRDVQGERLFGLSEAS